MPNLYRPGIIHCSLHPGDLLNIYLTRSLKVNHEHGRSIQSHGMLEWPPKARAEMLEERIWNDGDLHLWGCSIFNKYTTGSYSALYPQKEGYVDLVFRMRGEPQVDNSPLYSRFDCLVELLLPLLGKGCRRPVQERYARHKLIFFFSFHDNPFGYRSCRLCKEAAAQIIIFGHDATN